MHKRKSSKQKNREDSEWQEETQQSPAAQANDFSKIREASRVAVEKFKEHLMVARSPAEAFRKALENVDVRVGSGESKRRLKLHEFADPVRNGRMVDVLLTEEAHITPILNGIKASGMCPNPNKPTPERPLTISVPIPPPTLEQRQSLVQSISKAVQDANKIIQDERDVHHKMLARLFKERLIVRDTLQAARETLAKEMASGLNEVKKLHDEAKKFHDEAKKTAEKNYPA